MKKTNKKFYAVIIGMIAVAMYFLLFPTGIFSPSSSVAILNDSINVISNPSLSNYQENWTFGGWSSANHYPTNAEEKHTESTITLKQSGNDMSFYAVAIGQGSGPTVLNWAPRSLYVPINESFHNIVMSKIRVDDVTTFTPTSCLGIGIDFWFDAKLPNGTLAAVEIYVFQHMAGIYAFPVGTSKSVSRADWNFSSSGIGLAWTYMYFHSWQDQIGVYTEHKYELYEYLQNLKQQHVVYKDAEFYLTKFDVCMELFYASGTYTIDYAGLEQVSK